MIITNIKKEIENVEITVELEDGEWGIHLNNAITKINNNVKIDGYRKGKAPIDVIKKKYSSQTIVNEAYEPAIKKIIQQLFTNEKYKENVNNCLYESCTVTDAKPEYEKLIVSLKFDTNPIVTLPDLNDIKVTKQEINVSESEIENEIKRLTKKDTMLSHKEGTAEFGDSVNIDFVGKLNGEPFPGGSAQSHDLVLGSKSFIPGFEEQLIGTKVGDIKTIELMFPSDYHANELAGKLVTFDVTINSIHLVSLPELTEEYLAKFNINVKNKDELKEYLKKQLIEWKEYTQKKELQDEITKQLIAKTKVSHFPAFFVKQEEQRIIEHFKNEANHKQMPFGVYLKHIGFKDENDLNNKKNSLAIDNLTIALAIQKLIYELKLDATDDEIQSHLEKLAKLYNVTVENIKHSLNNDFTSITAFILQEKVFDYFIKK